MALQHLWQSCQERRLVFGQTIGSRESSRSFSDAPQYWITIAVCSYRRLVCFACVFNWQHGKSQYFSFHPLIHLADTPTPPSLICQQTLVCSLQPLSPATAVRETVEWVGSFCILPQLPFVLLSACCRELSQSPNGPAQVRLLSSSPFQHLPASCPQPSVKGPAGCRKPSKATSEWKLSDVCEVKWSWNPRHWGESIKDE